ETFVASATGSAERQRPLPESVCAGGAIVPATVLSLDCRTRRASRFWFDAQGPQLRRQALDPSRLLLDPSRLLLDPLRMLLGPLLRGGQQIALEIPPAQPGQAHILIRSLPDPQLHSQRRNLEMAPPIGEQQLVVTIYQVIGLYPSEIHFIDAVEGY